MTIVSYQNVFITIGEGVVSSAPSEVVPSEAPTMSAAEKAKEQIKEIADEVAHKIGIPLWGLVAIVVGKFCFLAFIYFVSLRD